MHSATRDRSSSVVVPYDKPTTTWKILSTSLNSAERDYIKFYLGQSLIEQCEAIETEIDSLLDIWRDYRNETVPAYTSPAMPTLAEPPALRKRLTAEIEFFLKHIHDQCEKDDRIFHRRLSNGHNWSVINYALVSATGDEERRIRERPASARDRHGRETPILVIPEPVANIDDTKIVNPLSPRTTSNIDPSIVRNKLANFTLDDIIQRLREAVKDDIKTLEHHVTYIHQKLEEEVDYRAKTRGLLREPTLGELRDERNRLEKEIYHTTTALITDSVESTHPIKKQTSSSHDTSRRSSSSSLNSSSQSPRSSLDEIKSKPTTSNTPLRALPTDTMAVTKPCQSTDRKVPVLSTSGTKSSAPVLLRLGSIKEQDLLKKYPSLTTTVNAASVASAATTTMTTTAGTITNTTANTSPAKAARTRETSSTRVKSADKFRQMVLDCRETRS